MMTKDKMRRILSGVLDKEPQTLDLPDSTDWRRLENKFQTKFPDEFIWFMELMTEFSFPGEILNVRVSGNTNGNDGIEFTYDHEIKNGTWPTTLIPFYSIGNGDYFCLSIKEADASQVYYYYHDDQKIDACCDNFESWIKELPNFLS
jgi:hypothetical protein